MDPAGCGRRTARRLTAAGAVSCCVLATAAGGLVVADSASAAVARPAAPSGLRVGSSAHAVSLTWRGTASRFTITQATNQRMTRDRRSYTVRGPANQFTPVALESGTRYYFQVRAVDGARASAPAPAVSAVADAAAQPVRVMTYNVLEATTDGHSEGGQIVAPWAQRQIAAARLIRQGDPDVVAVQEAASWAGPVKGPRQADSLAATLGGGYTLADTEVPPSEKHYFRTGCYILYKTSAYQAIGAGGHWDIGNWRWAAYQLLENRATGARFLFVSTHLRVGRGLANDRRRQAETRHLLADGQRLADADHVPVVYAGDFNSHGGPNIPHDGPGIAMRAAHVADALQVAQRRTNARFDSANGYQRRPPAFGESVDHIYAPAGVGVTAWRQILDLRHGHFTGVMASDHNPVEADLQFPY